MLMNDEVPGDSISGGRLAAAVAPPVRLLTYLWIGNEWTLSGVTKGEEIVVDHWFKCGWVNGDQSQEDGRGQPLAMVTVERIMSNYHRRPHWHLHTIKYMKKRSGNDSSIGILQKRSPSSIRMRWEQKMKNQRRISGSSSIGVNYIRLLQWMVILLPRIHIHLCIIRVTLFG